MMKFLTDADWLFDTLFRLLVVLLIVAFVFAIIGAFHEWKGRQVPAVSGVIVDKLHRPSRITTEFLPIGGILVSVSDRTREVWFFDVDVLGIDGQKRRRRYQVDRETWESLNVGDDWLPERAK